MCSYCVDVGNVGEGGDGPARESLASSLQEGWELDCWRGEGRGIFRGNVEGAWPAALGLLPFPSSLCAVFGLGGGRQEGGRGRGGLFVK